MSLPPAKVTTSFRLEDNIAPRFHFHSPVNRSALTPTSTPWLLISPIFWNMEPKPTEGGKGTDASSSVVFFQYLAAVTFNLLSQHVKSNPISVCLVVSHVKSLFEIPEGLYPITTPLFP